MKNNKNIVIIAMCIAVFVMVIGYAAFSTNLIISGTANIESNWKVLFTKIEKVEANTTSGATEIDAPQAIGTTATFNVDLQSPGDKIVYKITLANQGSLDAVISEIKAQETGSDALSFTVTGIKVGDKLASSTTKEITIEIKYLESVTTQPEVLKNKLMIEINCVQDLNQTITEEDIEIVGPVLTTLSGNNTLSLENSVDRALANYTITGNSVQNGTPSPDTPVEIESVGVKTKNLADLSKIIPDTATSYTTFNFDNTTGTLELTSKPNMYNYTLLYLERDLGVKFEVGKTYYYSANVTISGKQTSDNTTVVFGVRYDGDTSSLAKNYTKNGTYNMKGKFTYDGQQNIRLFANFNYGSPEPAQVKFENIYVSEVDEFEPYGYKLPITVDDGTTSTTENIYIDEPLRCIGSNCDYIDFSTKQIVRKIGEYKITGEERWDVSSDYPSKFYASGIIDALYSPDANVLSNQYVGRVSGSAKSWGNGDIWIQSIVEYPRLYIGDERYDNIQDFKQSLSNKYVNGKPVIVHYPLATLDIKIIELPTIYIPEGTVTVSAKSENGVSIPLSVSYYKMV